MERQDAPADVLWEAERARAERAAIKQINLRRRARNVMVTVSSGTGGVMLVLYATSPHDPFRPFFGLFAIAGLGFFILIGITTYLQGGFNPQQETEDEIQRQLTKARAAHQTGQQKIAEELKGDVAGLHETLKNVQESVARAASLAAQVSDEDRASLVTALRAELEKDAVDRVLAEIRSQAVDTARSDAKELKLLELFGNSKARLGQELRELGRRGNTNLALGGVTSLIGLMLLGVTVFQDVSVPTDWWTLLSHFGPRFSLVVFIELFAYFFLSLYKSSLQEIKYFQNELTNVEAKQIALRTAIDAGNENMVTTMVNALAATERNHVLSKDQTTVELEKAKLDRQGAGDILKALTELLKKQGKAD